MLAAANPSPVAAGLVALSLIVLLAGTQAPTPAQSIDVRRSQDTQSLGTKRKRGREMLKAIKADIEADYYDSTFRGIDFDVKFKEADEMIKTADSNAMIFGIIARLLLDFNDSHLYLIPPDRNTIPDYGWETQMIGDECYVTAVKPGSDAAAKNVKAGDRVYFVNEMKPTRADTWKIQYLLNVLRPQQQLQVILQTPGAEPRGVTFDSKFVDPWRSSRERKDKKSEDGEDEETSGAATKLRRSSQRYFEMGDDLFIWKMPSFAVEPGEVDKVMKIAGGRRALVIDLRQNGGGYESTMLRLISHFIEQETTIGEMIRRKNKRTLVAKPLANRTFKGKLVVLIDSRSGSAAEVFARVMQLTRRAVVVGDVSAGAVMRSRFHQHEFLDGAMSISVVPYGISVTDADLLMTDGKRLEHVGVVPDELRLPTAADMAAGRDPVLTRAAEIVGVKLAPEKAGKIFPVEWRE